MLGTIGRNALLALVLCQFACYSWTPEQHFRDLTNQCSYQGQHNLTARRGVPCIIRPGNFANTKVARLSTEILSATFTKPLTPPAQSSSQRTFFYLERGKADKESYAQFRDGLVPLQSLTYLPNLTFTELFSRLKENAKDSGDSTSPEHAERRDFLYWHGKLAHVINASEYMPNKTPQFIEQTYVWIGGHGATTQLHYDSSDNVYYQVSGRKTFFLVPPQFHTALRLFPFTHPYNRQSQHNFTSATSPPLVTPLSAAPAPPVENPVSSVPCWSASLRAGDSLFLPAYHFHHVSSLSPVSISVNSWSSPRQLAPLLTSLAQALLPNAPAGLQQAVSVATLFRSALVAHPLCGHDFEPILASRYTQPVLALMQASYEREVPAEARPTACPASVELPGFYHSAVTQIVDEACTVRQELSAPIRDLVLIDWFEGQLARLLPGPNLYAYLRLCVLTPTAEPRQAQQSPTATAEHAICS